MKIQINHTLGKQRVLHNAAPSPRVCNTKVAKHFIHTQKMSYRGSCIGKKSLSVAKFKICG